MNKINFAFTALFVFIASKPAYAADVVDIANAAEGGLNAEAHTSKGGLPQFDPTWFESQFFWLIIAFAFLYIVFSKITLPTISGVIENRKNIIESDLEMAEKLTAEADSVHDDYQASLAVSSLSAEAMIKKADDKNKDIFDKQSDLFREKSEAAILETENNIIKAKEKAMADMNTVIAEVAAEAIEKIIGTKADNEKVLSIVEKMDYKHNATQKNKVKAA